MKSAYKASRCFSFFTICLTLISNSIYPASASDLEKCRITASSKSWVSIGFPVAEERLKGNPKILVIPFKLKDTSYEFDETDKSAALEAAKIIQKLSNNQSNPRMIFAPLQKIDSVKEDIVQLKINQQNGWQKRDESQSTWGFVRKLLSDSDVNIDYSGIDAVILQGPPSNDQEWIRKASIAEAMMFFKDSGDPFFRPINTAEGSIFNASLIIGGSFGNATTYAHEIMHLYGLTDLYGGTSSPNDSSLMSGSSHRLLAYEKWILGWLPDNQITCLDGTDSGSLGRQITEIKFRNLANDQVVVISQKNSSDAIIIEQSVAANPIAQGTDSHLTFYSLKNDERPPIFMNSLLGYGSDILTYNNGVPSTRYIASTFKTDEYQLLISNIDVESVTLQLVPKSEFGKLSNLQSDARKLQAEADAKAKAEADAKAKAEADAKAKIDADAKAKIDADLKAKGSIKLKSIVCLKGKTQKKVTAIKPKCPIGYKQK